MAYPASAVCIGKRGVLLQGPSGAGKSDLTLRLIDRGAVLISDDYVNLKKNGDALIASPPDQIAGKLEIRGIGIEEFPYAHEIPVALVASLLPRDEIPRFPDPAYLTIEKVRIRHLKLHAFDSSAPQKLEYFLKKI